MTSPTSHTPSRWAFQVTVPAEEAFQVVKHANVDVTINTGGVMKPLDCDGSKYMSPHVEKVPPHAEQGLRTQNG